MARLALILLALIAAPAAAQEPEWRWAREVEVRMNPFAYEPAEIRLEAGQPVKLRFINAGRGTRSFHAPGFFAAARVRRDDDEAVADGAIRIAEGDVRTIALVPAPGRYRVRSASLLHRLLGMSGLIVVE